jgi:formyltetrahydrofolate deformylase
MFAMRTRFESTNEDAAEVRGALEEATQPFTPWLTLRRESELPRVLIMVSQYDHCLVDLLYRQAAGEIAMDVPVIVSNHTVCEPIAKQYGIPFRHIPVTKDTKDEAEDQLREVMKEFAIDAVVLARYMQILSDRLCQDLQGRAINIHHSFLPGFKGARPYHQAYDRGVKLIGATAHFVTADLDEGPIIEQGVERVEHHHTADELALIGRDIERLVLARAVTLFVEDRVLLEGHRTVVFS